METKAGTSLFYKALIILLVPVLFQITLNVHLSNLYEDAAKSARAQARERELIDAENTLGTHAYALVVEIAETLQNKGQFDKSFDHSVSELYKEERRFKKLISHNRVAVRKLEQRKQLMESLIERARYARGDLLKDHPAGSEGRKKVYREIRGYVAKLELAVGKENMPLTSSADLEYSNNQSAIIAIALQSFAAFFWTVMTYWLFNRGIVRKLLIIRNNSVRLEARQPLTPPLSGSDELARLDQAFHETAATLDKGWRKQRAIKENARDMICTLDNRIAFLDASEATTSTIGYSPEELIGSRLINMICDDDKVYTNQKFKVVTETGGRTDFETRLVARDGKIIDVLISAQYWEKEDRLFCVFHDITERKEAQRLRMEVVQMVSHDLRSPLSSIRGVFEILAEGMVGNLNAKGQQLLTRADSSAHLMLTLVNDLLDIEKLEADMLQLVKQNVQLSSLFEQVVANTSTTASSRGVHLEVVPTDLVIHADPDRIVQILVNLVSNAIKFSPQDGSVNIAASRLSQFVEISVADQGKGIPPHMEKVIFDRFRQVESSDAKKGTGLGLAICKALVELHGGDIRVESQPGRGCWFSFRIPV